MKHLHCSSALAILWSTLHVEGFLPSVPHGNPLQSSRPRASPCSSSYLARVSVPALQSVAEPAVVHESTLSAPKELMKRLSEVIVIADRFSRDIASFYVVPGRVSQNVDLFRLLTFFEWKVDVFIDEVAGWEKLLPPGTLSERGGFIPVDTQQLDFARTFVKGMMVGDVLHKKFLSPAEMPSLNEMWSFDRRDIKKFGPVMNLVIDGQKTFEELVNTVEAEFGDDDEVMKFIDKCIYMFIKYSGDLIISDSEEEAKKKYPLEEYKYLRMWSGGGLPLCSVFWYGKNFPQDGTVEDVAAAAALVNDLYDYTRDRDFGAQLSVWRYFDDVEDAIAYVRDFYYDVYDRCSPELKEFVKVSLRYQQDVPTNSVRGYDKEWYDKLNAIFSHDLLEARDVVKEHVQASR